MPINTFIENPIYYDDVWFLLKNKKITAGERALLKAVAKGRGRRGGRSPKKKKQEVEPPVKSQVQIEVEAEEKRAKIKQEEKRLRQQDRFLELEDFRQQREFLTAAQDRQQRELARQQQFITDTAILGQRENQRQTDFISGQNRILSDQQIAQYNQQQENFRAGQRDQQRILDRQEQARLADRRIDLQRQQIDAAVETDVVRQDVERRRIDAEVERYNIDARRFEAIRDRDIGLAERRLQEVQERVAQDNARQHAERQAQQQLVLEQLASMRQENTQRVLLEQNRIDNQRAVDAERAITDRELIQGFTATIDALNRLQTPQELPTGKGLVEDVELDSSSGTVQSFHSTLREQPQPEPQPEPQGNLSSQTVSSQPSVQRSETLESSTQSGSSELEIPIEEGFGGGHRTRPEEKRKKPKRLEGGATEAEIRSEIGTTSTESSVREEDPEPTPIKRQVLTDIESGATLQSTPQEEQLIRQGYREEPEVYKPQVKTLAEVRAENPVEDVNI